MRKTMKKKAASHKKSKPNAAAKKNTKPVKQQKPETVKKMTYPEWTTPEHLGEKDHKALKRFYELFHQGKSEVAMNFISGCDTIVREQIPSDIWKKCGGKLTPKGEEELQSAKQTAEKGKNVPPEPVISKDDISIVKGEKMQPEAKQRHILANSDARRQLYVVIKGKLQEVSEDTGIDCKAMDEAKFHKKSNLEEFIIENYKTLFGENVIFIDCRKNLSQYFPNMFMLCLGEQGKPRMHIIEINHYDDSLGELYAKITHYLASLKPLNYREDFLAELCRIIDADKQTKKEIQACLKEEQDIHGFLSEMIANSPAILLVSDNENVTLDLMQMVYENWRKMVRRIIIKKYYCGNDTYYSIEPKFADIWKNEKSKKAEIVKCTEEYHLNCVPESIRDIYKEIKTALLKADPSIEFNPKKIYISLRKNKNIAFFHLRKKISLVVMNPEDDTSMHIQHHEIKTLPASVQKFWNGSCCTIVIENEINLNEVINLLKKMIAKA